MAEQAQLRALCKKGELKELLARLQSTGSQEKLKQGFEPDLSQPIHYAALHGDSEMVRELVENYGCDPVCQNVHGITPLHCASYCGRLNVVEYMVKRCPSAATLKDTQDRACPLVYLAYCMVQYVTVLTPLNAVERISPHGDHIISIFKLLLSVTDFQSIPSSILSRVHFFLRLPVHHNSLADMKDIIDAVKPVLESEKEFHLEIYNCLNIAVNKERWGFVTYLLQRFTQPIRDEVAMVAANTKSTYSTYSRVLTPFQKACKKANISVVRIFLDLNICKPDVISIEEALHREYYELLYYLLISARRPIVMDQYQHSTSFLSAVLTSRRSYDQKLIKLIASNGINGRDARGNTVLHVACKHRVMFLIEEYCNRDQNTVNKIGRLPLHIACSQCYIEIVKLVSSEPGLNVNTQDSDGNTPVHMACKLVCRYDKYHDHQIKPNFVQCISYLVLEKECDINVQNNDGKLPIHVLLENISQYSEEPDHLTFDEMNQLVQLVTKCENFNVNAQDKGGNTPLHIALKCDNSKTALYLTSKFQCDVDLYNNAGYLPLHYAVESSIPYKYNGLSELEAKNMFLEVVEAVSKNCTQLHKQNDEGLTPLHIAWRKERMDVVHYLVFVKECVPNLCDSSDTYSSLDIHLACKQESDIDLLKALTTELNVNNYKHEHYYMYSNFTRTTITPLHVACENNNLPAIRVLTQFKCDFTLINSQGMIPLHLACSKSFDCVKLLDVTNDDVRQCDENGNTPLHYACKHNLEDVVNYLVSNFKCDLTIQNKNGELPLHLACNKSLEMVKMVSDSDLNFNLQTKEGNTPLHIACTAGKPDIVKYLVTICKCDSSMKVRNRYDRLPIHYACKHSLEIVKMVDQTSTFEELLTRSKSVFHRARVSALDIACSYGSLDVVIYLINNKGCTLSVLQNDYIALTMRGEFNPLCEFPQSKRDRDMHPNIVEYLITECGYDPSVTIRDTYYNYSGTSSVIEHACKIGNLDLMKALTVLSVDIIDNKGNTPLHYASIHSCTAIAQYLIECGCDQTIINHEGELALHIACRHSLQIAQLLINCNVNSLTENEDANSPLHIACGYKQEDIIFHLVEKSGCNVNLLNGCGNTALHIACINRKHKIVKYLLHNELCCAEIHNNSGDLPLHIVIKYYQPDLVLVKAILQKCDVNSQDSDGNTALHIACSKRNYELIMLLLQDELCRANVPNKRGEFPLHCLLTNFKSSINVAYQPSSPVTPEITETLHMIIVQVAKRYGEAAMTADHNGVFPMDIIINFGSIDLLEAFYKVSKINLDQSLHLACKHKQSKLVRWLIDYGASTETIDAEGNAPEHMCISDSNPSLSVETLLQLGTINIHRQNKFGNTVLHLACKLGKGDIIEHLLSFTHTGSVSDALTIQNNYGDTPLHYLAIRELSPKVISLIKCSYPNQQNSDGNTPLHTACKFNNIKFSELLLMRQCDLTICNGNGELPLHIASSQSLELVKLIAKSENVNSQTNSGDTPLHIACRYHLTNIIMYLITELKCSVQELNKCFESPFHLLLNNSHILQDNSILCHVSQPARDLQNVDGNTLLHIACRNGDVNAVSFLVESLKCTVNVISEKSSATPLHFACSQPSLGLVKLVHKCDPVTQLKESFLLGDIKCVPGDTSLHIACKAGNIKIIEYLLINGHRIALNVRNSEAEFPLHLVCRHSNEKMVRIFVPYIADFDCSAINGSGDTPLHMACKMNPTASYINVLVNQMKCKTDVVNESNDLPLHVACKATIVYRKNVIVKMLSHNLSEDHFCLQNSDGNTALHELLKCNSHDYYRSGNVLHLIQFLAKQMPDQILSIYNKEGKQLMHLACQHQKLHVIKYLCELLLHVKLPNAVLHEACLNDNAGVLEYIIENVKDLDTNIPNQDGDLPLHVATRRRICINGTALLIKRTKNINYTNNEGNTPLHELCLVSDQSIRFYSRSEVDFSDQLNLFLSREDIDLSIQNSQGQTPLHLICKSGRYNDLKLVISKKKINPNIQDNDGLTPLHILSHSSKFECVEVLCAANANPSLKDNRGQTPLTLARDPQIINLLIKYGADPQPLYDMHRNFFQSSSSDGPPPTPVKLLMIGNPSVGKTTLVGSLRSEGSERIVLSEDFEHTTGIVTTTFSSKIYGDVMFYDFAGQREYYASHDAVIHSTIKNVPPIVLVLVNLTDNRKRICSQIHYWINFIAKRCASFNDKAHMIIVFSHADILESKSEDPSLKVSKLLKSIQSQIDANDSAITLKEVLHMNCKEVNSREIRRLQFILKESTSQLRQGGVMHFNSHCFYVLLLQIFKDNKLNYVTLGRIIDKIKFSSRSTRRETPLFVLSTDQKVVTDMCKDLDNRSHIMFIEHPSVIKMSWLVLNTQPLLHDMLGSLFAPANFPQHCPLSYSTGVIPLSRFKEHFGEYNYTATMKLTFLTRMEYCREITDDTVLESIVEQEGYSETDKYYFFPNLVSLDRPTDKWNTDSSYVYKSGWLIQCTMEGDFFSPHFIQALLLRLVFAFVPKNQSTDSRSIIVDEDDSDDEENQIMALVIKRVCSVWKNGIYWREQNGVVTIVEVIDEKTLVLLMQCPQGSEVPLIKRRSSIVSMVFNAKNEFCPRAELIEFFLHPECVKHPFYLDKKNTFSIIDIKNAIKESNSIVDGRMYVTNSFDKMVDLKQLLYFEPYSELNAETVTQLFGEANSDKPVEHDLLLSITKQLQRRYQIFAYLCHMMNKRIRSRATEETNDTARLLYNLLKQVQQISRGSTYHHLREFINQISIFRGRLPPQAEALKSRDCFTQDESQDDDADIAEDVLHYQPQEHQLDLIEENGKEVRVVKRIAWRWDDVATRLQFDLDDINRIKRDNLSRSNLSCREMFSLWLKGEGRQPADWETLIKALREAEFSELAEELQSILTSK